MAANDTLDDGKSDAGAFKFVYPMKTLEHAEELAGILHVKTDAVIFHKVNGLVSVDVPPYFNSGCRFGAAKLDGIGQQVRKNLTQHRNVSPGGRERADVDLRVPAHRRQAWTSAKTSRARLLHIDFGNLHFLPAGADEFQDVVNEGPHPAVLFRTTLSSRFPSSSKLPA